MGLDGCICLGGLASALAGAFLPSMPPVLYIGVCLLIGMAAGGLWLLVPAWLKAYYGVNEVIMTWMLSYIAILLCQFLATLFQLPEDVTSAVQQIRTPKIPPEASLPQLIPPYQLSAGLFIALGVCFLFYLFCSKTKAGFEQRSVGLAPRYAEYAGINVRRVWFYSLLASGAFGGLCGSVEVLGVHYRYIQGFSLDMGANGIMVSLMGRLHPLGVPLAGIFMGTIQNGARAMSRNTNVSLDTVRILIAVIVICITAEGLYEYLHIKKKIREGD
jgi:simple sugar transport system permease protein